MYEPRFYRKWVDSNLVNFTVTDGESDIFISAGENLKNEARKAVRKYRREIIDYIKTHPAFETALEPIPFDDNAPKIVKSMLKSALLAGVGPMAAVAGAISEFVGRELLRFTNEVIIENGGDIFIKTDKERKIAIFAGDSPLTNKIAIKVKPESTPLGVCTSSATVGHSLSFGKAEAVSVVAKGAALADACATATCNRVKTESDIKGALDFAKSVESVLGAVVIYKGKVGSIGDIELACHPCGSRDP